ncbi:small RNA 2'-O-methyltransferase-like [Octopus sinensis]|uniref:Small RNA 2'-O-methyltransferase n=1 Tax=Octopus sinensis TaxID=2607531 RepID=A0A6P7THT8_9MOLL|nr:small RNA 2'-O-methyltransferase-like [Octopus sinensis]
MSDAMTNFQTQSSSDRNCCSNTHNISNGTDEETCQEESCDSSATENIATKEDGKNTDEKHSKFTGFGIPLNVQRYEAVRKELGKENVESCIDFGSSECRVIDQFSQIASLKQLALVDLDRNTLVANLHRLTPRLMHYSRSVQLTVNVYEGDVTKYDSRMKNYDAITMIELIEHLIPEDLKKCCNTVFNQLRPKLVVVTTPNCQFNVVFGMTAGEMRHWDHKYEWTMAEFQSWGDEMCTSFGYKVEYSGVGVTDLVPDVGFCSQIAVFKREEGFLSKPSVDLHQEVYKYITKIDFPFTTEESKQNILSESVKYYLRKYACDWNILGDHPEELDGRGLEETNDSNSVKVPLSELMLYSSVWENCKDRKALGDFLLSSGYTLSSDGESVLVEKIQFESNNYSSSSDESLNEDDQYGDAEDDYSRSLLIGGTYKVPCIEEQWD